MSRFGNLDLAVEREKYLRTSPSLLNLMRIRAKCDEKEEYFETRFHFPLIGKIKDQDDGAIVEMFRKRGIPIDEHKIGRTEPYSFS